VFKNIKNQRFIILILAILVVLFLFVFSLLNKELNRLDSIKELQKEMLLANALSNIIHEIQKERGISSGYLAGSGTAFQEILYEQRRDTDKIISQLEEKFPNLNLQIFLNKTRLTQERQKIDRHNLNTKEAILFYSEINEKLFRRVIGIAKVSKVPKLTEAILAYSNFLYTKENAGVERAIGTVILSNKSFLKRDRVEFIKLIAMQELYLNKFYNYAPQKFIQYYKNNMSFPELKILTQIREKIVNAESYQSLEVNPRFWLENMTIKVNKLKKVSDFIGNSISENIEQDYEISFSKYLYYLFLNFLLLIVLGSIGIVFIKNIQKERKKRLLLEKYVINSTTDIKGNITYVSEAFCRISGYSEKELLGKSHNIVRHPDMPSSIFEEIWKTIQKKKIWSGRIKNLKKDGSSYWVYATIEPLLDTKGYIQGYAAVRIDITSSISLEQRIINEVEKNRQKDKTMLQQSKLAQMGEMISMIAHQWRQPLSAISATSGSLSLKSQIGDIDKQTTIELSNKITEYAQHLSSTIDDFRNFFKENKTQEMTTFKEMLLATLSIVEVSLKNENIAIELNIKTTSTELLTYVNEVKQVILNIIKNAEDALLDKKIQNPKIIIEIQENRLSISDNAGGIAEEIIERIFEPYFSTKTQKDGTGLGLYMSKTIIEDHCSGELNVSNHKDGATFSIKLPLHKRAN
jgi:PAS domain S-box-containing protein